MSIYPNVNFVTSAAEAHHLTIFVNDTRRIEGGVEFHQDEMNRVGPNVDSTKEHVAPATARRANRFLPALAEREGSNRA